VSGHDPEQVSIHPGQLMCELPGFPVPEGMLFAKNHHDDVVSACSGTVQAVRWVYDLRTEGLDVCLWAGWSVSSIGRRADEATEENSGDGSGRR